MLCPNGSSLQIQARWTQHAPHFLDQRTETQRHYTQVSHLNLQPQLPALALGFPKCITPQSLWERNVWDVNVTWLVETCCLGLSCLRTMCHSPPRGTGGPAAASCAGKKLSNLSEEDLLGSADEQDRMT